MTLYLLFFCSVALVAAVFVYTQFTAARLRAHKQQQAEKLYLELNPVYREKVEEDRRFQLQQQQMALVQRKQEFEIAKWHAQFQLESYLQRTRVTPEMYLVNCEPTTLTALPSLKPRQLEKPMKDTDPETAITLYPEPRDFAAILERWRPSPQQIYLIDTLKDPVMVPVTKTCHIGLAGPTGAGKTNTFRLVLAQVLAVGATVYLANPNYAPIKQNGTTLEDWRPIAARLAQPVARKIEDIKQLLTWAVEELDTRRDHEQITPERGADIYIALGEWPAIVARWKEAPEYLGLLLREARQYGIHVISEFQDALVKTIGGSSGLRECYRTVYFFGGDPTTARALLDLRGQAPLIEVGLGDMGAGVLRSFSCEATYGRVPFLSNKALYMLLGTPTNPLNDNVVEGSLSAVAADTAAERVYGIPGQCQDGASTMPELPGRERYTGVLQNHVERLAERSAATADRLPTTADDLKAYGPDDRQLNALQVAQFLVLYQQLGNIQESLAAIKNDKGQGLGRRYFAHASNIVKEHKLRN